MIERRRIAVYYNVGWGGGRRWLYECVSRLAKFHDIDLFCIDRESIGRQLPDVASLGLPTNTLAFRDVAGGRTGSTRLLEPALSFVDLLRFDQASKRIAARIDSSAYDLLFASIGGYTEAPLVMRHCRTPSVYYCHEPMRIVYEPAIPRPYNGGGIGPRSRRLWHSMFYGGLIRAWDREGTLRATQVLANSHYTADYVARAYGVASRVNYPAVDTLAFHPGEGNRERFVLSVGELLPSKGFDDAIHAIATIRKDRRPKLLLICNRSYAPERAYIEREARDAGVGLEIRVGLPDSELKLAYQAAALMLYTPHREPFGLAAIEAMASGLPVVAVREAGPAETIVDGVTGFLCERDASTLGLAVSEVLNDGALRARMSRAARRHAVDTWTWERSVKELAETLSDVALSKRASKDGSRVCPRLVPGLAKARR